MNPTPEKNYGLTLDRREKAVLTGTGLHVSSLQLEEGRLLVDGAIDGVVYDGGAPKRRGGFLRRALG